MKIFNHNVQKMLKTYSKQNSNNKVKSTKISKKDKLTLSTHAKEFQIAMDKLKDIPDVREEKIAEIKAKVKSGTYKIDAGKIVEKMLD